MTVDHDITLTKSRLTKKQFLCTVGMGTRTPDRSPQPPMISNLGPTKFCEAFGNFNELSTSTSTFI